jgi:uncharacterized LabA/DUF88 family protein
MRKIAVFVDAGYFWVQAVHVIHACKKPRESVTIDYAALRQEVLTQVSAQFPSHDLLRVYWYDGPGTGGKTDSHYAIDDLDDFKLRLGTRNGVGNQKAVDGLIITDMISLAQSRSITNALLVSGDADLAPGVVAAQGLGIRVHLLSMGSTAATSHILKAEADFKAHWEDAIVQKFATPTPAHAAAPAPTPVAAAAPLAPTIDTTLLAGIAQEAHERLGPEELALLSATGPVPREIDAMLLRVGATRLRKRRLDADEVRLIRAEFKRRITS